MKTYRLLIVVVCLLLFAFASVKASGPKQEDELLGKRVTIRMDRKPLYTVMWRLIMKYDIAVGFEESKFDRNHRHYYFETDVPQNKDERAEFGDKVILPSVPLFSDHLITLDANDERLENVLNSIVRQMVNYQWEISDGVVDIFPSRGRDERLVELLNTKVADFWVGEGDVIGTIKARLMLSTPEFKSFLAANELEYDTTEPGSSLSDQLLSEEMRFRNLTFRELLNSITRKKRGGWILQIKTRKEKPGKEYVELYI